MTTNGPRPCWCGGPAGPPVGPHYVLCAACGGAMLKTLPPWQHFEVAADASDFYGRGYWLEYQRQRSFPDIEKRAQADLSERCVFWLERLLEVIGPPGRALELGCGHGGFVKLLGELGFDAVGTELSPWVVEFARRTFGVRVLAGRLERLDLEPGFRCIAAFDVLEHLDDPLGTMRRCGELLAPDGVVLLQTPWYRGEGPDWSMFQEEEHVHLFTDRSIRMLLERAGLPEVTVRASLFPYDMFVVASRTPVAVRSADATARPLLVRIVLDLWRQVAAVRNELDGSEGDRAARLEQIHALTAALKESEGDRAARLEQIHALTAALKESEADRAARLAALEEAEATQSAGSLLRWIYRRLSRR